METTRTGGGGEVLHLPEDSVGDIHEGVGGEGEGGGGGIEG